MEDLRRFMEGPLSGSWGASLDGRFPEPGSEDEEGEGEVCIGDAGRGIRNGFFFFSNRGRPQPQLGHFWPMCCSQIPLHKMSSSARRFHFLLT